MPSFSTVVRAVVMVAAGVIVVKAWQLYGPSGEQMKLWAGRAVELAHTALNERQQLAPATGEPAAYPHAETAVPVKLSGIVATPPNGMEADEFLAVPPILSPAAPRGEPASASNQSPPPKTPHPDRLPALLARLGDLGAVDPQLVTWGSSGQLYRFCCRVALGGTQSYTRHFESVAAEPLAAVEEVVAKVEAWRTAQGRPGELR